MPDWRSRFIEWTFGFNVAVARAGVFEAQCADMRKEKQAGAVAVARAEARERERDKARAEGDAATARARAAEAAGHVQAAYERLQPLHVAQGTTFEVHLRNIRPVAQAGGTDPSKLPEALKSVQAWVEQKL